MEIGPGRGVTSEGKNGLGRG